MNNDMSVSAIRKMTYPQLTELAGDIRRRILDAVSKNGGHLASNLGMVEATIAIHRVFDTPADTVIFDVGHQSYTHKLLTGRGAGFDALRKSGGVSGFTNPQESIYDKTYAGHAGSSLSTAIGLAQSRALRGDRSYVVAVVGDGAFTNGMIYEALNNCVTKDLRLVIILNDNKMSISRNVGGLSHFLDKTRTSRQYFELKHSTARTIGAIPGVGDAAVSAMRDTKNLMRRVLVGDNFFECLGIDYLGPVDGHDIQKLETVLREARTRGNCCVVHIRTRKGRGYSFAQRDPEKYHAVGPFELSDGAVTACGGTFSDAFGQAMCHEAETDGSLCAVSAAMCDGTGLGDFARRFPERFFDVGIAEEHAAAFSGGLALDGRYPVCAVYSTFSQRIFDQVFHDVALQRAGVMFALDRSGLVPGDGVTHQGLFDVGLFSAIPGAVIYSPETCGEMRAILHAALGKKEFCFLRYPKGREQEYDRSPFVFGADGCLTYCDLPCEGGADGGRVVIVCYGRITAQAVQAARRLTGEHSVRIIKLIRIFPLPEQALAELIGAPKLLYLLEEGALTGGIAEKICAMLAASGGGVPRLVVRAVKNAFLPHGELEDLYRSCGFRPEQIAGEISQALN